MTEIFDREKLFSDANIAILATVDSKNRPHGMPIWYIYQDGVFIMEASGKSQKVRNIKRNGNATLIIDRREPPYHAAMIRGRAEIGPQAPDHLLLELAVRYLGKEWGNAYHAQASFEGTLTITLHPDEVIEYHGTAGMD